MSLTLHLDEGDLENVLLSDGPQPPSNEESARGTGSSRWQRRTSGFLSQAQSALHRRSGEGSFAMESTASPCSPGPSHAGRRLSRIRNSRRSDRDPERLGDIPGSENISRSGSI